MTRPLVSIETRLKVVAVVGLAPVTSFIFLTESSAVRSKIISSILFILI